MLNTGITLTASMRSNLMSLKNIAAQMDKTQNILSTGKKVNSAIDNASSYYQSRSLTNRAADLNSLLDSMGQGIQTLQAANEGIEAATAYLEQAKSVAEQALSLPVASTGTTAPDTPIVPDEPEAPTGPQLVTKDLSWYVDNGYSILYNSDIDFDGKCFRGNTKFVLAEDVTYEGNYISDYEDNIIIDGNGHTMYVSDGDVNAAGAVILSDVVEMKNMKIEFVVPDYYEAVGITQAGTIFISEGSTLTLSNVEVVNTMTDGLGICVRSGATLNIDDTVSINATTPIVVNNGGVVNDASANAATFALRRNAPTQEAMATDDHVEINATYADYVDQYEHIINEFNTLIEDSSYQGVNLLTGGEMKVTFNETRTHDFLVKGEDIRSDKIGLNTINWTNKSDIETAIKEVVAAMGNLRSLATDLGNKYQVIQTRQSFTDALCDVLETGADDLVLADMNEASAEYLMLQTRQQLAVNSLSLASQSASSILSLFILSE